MTYCRKSALLRLVMAESLVGGEGRKGIMQESRKQFL
jgi:hypothetical protein